MERYIVPHIRRIPGGYGELEKHLKDMPEKAQRDLLQLLRTQELQIERAKRDALMGVLGIRR
jgi:hypothetical protein